MEGREPNHVNSNNNHNNNRIAWLFEFFWSLYLAAALGTGYEDTLAINGPALGRQLGGIYTSKAICSQDRTVQGRCFRCGVIKTELKALHDMWKRPSPSPGLFTTSTTTEVFLVYQSNFRTKGKRRGMSLYVAGEKNNKLRHRHPFLEMVSDPSSGVSGL